ncbi:hypothetical protein PMAYCL1PPCAC_12121 [Pristionchus mayeri]|uniref:Apoptosis regulator Bcl-2 family BH4 domain-containing protein n=1 Tax=Pristionchus mayeri TaxID=1317129 RepID=A0AAN4ZJF2_9BILA|nr:hypothetical protein PMAYCL1PPCAC_12121 [Pristionchus mayeri]
MGTGYEHDWEDPRLAAEGFVTDYIVWRLAKDGLEWHEAPDVPEGARIEHDAMRTTCEIFEERNRNELIELSEDLFADEGLHYEKYCQTVDAFGRRETDIQDEMSFGRMVAFQVGLIAFAGLICVQKAKEGNRRELGLIALYTSKYIDGKIRLTWIDSMRSWAGFVKMAENVIARRSQPRGVVRQPAPPPARQPPSRRSSLIFVATGVSLVGLGAFITHRVLTKSH